MCMDFLKRELDCLQEQFVVSIKRPPTESNKTVDVQCKLGEVLGVQWWHSLLSV